jgi:hypothetical protein
MRWLRKLFRKRTHRAMDELVHVSFRNAAEHLRRAAAEVRRLQPESGGDPTWRGAMNAAAGRVEARAARLEAYVKEHA